MKFHGDKNAATLNFNKPLEIGMILFLDIYSRFVSDNHKNQINIVWQVHLGLKMLPQNTTLENWNRR